ncbi:ubiquitin-2 like Rad60 SUMO-like-domain-containing protein [Paraphysoderma sedebokerense]|nr:ubiquitin-2 like Rad60 SUMO-like-domain-containing protein [Paraphysoderma sedebokerense]
MSTAASEPSPALEQPTTSITNSNSQLNPIAPSPQSENNSENASTQPPQPSQQTLTAPTSTSPSTKQTTPEPTSISPNEAIPADKVVLTFLLVSGKKKEGWVFNPSQTIGDIVKNVWEWWPKEWQDEQKPTAFESLKMLHRGRFLEADTTLEANKIPTGEVTTVHLVVRQKVESAGKDKDSSSKCCCIISGW